MEDCPYEHPIRGSGTGPPCQSGRVGGCGRGASSGAGGGRPCGQRGRAAAPGTEKIGRVSAYFPGTAGSRGARPLGHQGLAGPARRREPVWNRAGRIFRPAAPVRGRRGRLSGFAGPVCLFFKGGGGTREAHRSGPGSSACERLAYRPDSGPGLGDSPADALRLHDS